MALYIIIRSSRRKTDELLPYLFVLHSACRQFTTIIAGSRTWSFGQTLVKFEHSDNLMALHPNCGEGLICHLHVITCQSWWIMNWMSSWCYECTKYISQHLCLWVCEKVCSYVLTALHAAFKVLGLFPPAWGPRWNHFKD